jgi:hypothetical protein
VTLASLTAFAGHALADRGSGQGSPPDKRQYSHILDKLPPPPPGNLENLLRHGHQGSNLDGKGISPELLEKAKKLLKDPEAVKQIRDLLQNNPKAKELIKQKGLTEKDIASNLDPGKIDQLHDEFLKNKRQQSDSAVVPPKPIVGGSNPPAGGASGTELPSSSDRFGGTDRGTSAADAATNGATQQVPTAGSALKDRLTKFAEGLTRLDPSLRDSPGLRRAVEQLSRQLGTEDQRWNRLAAGAGLFQEKMQSWGESLRLNRLRAGRDWSWPKALTPSSLPQIRWPSVASTLSERPSLGGLPGRASAPPTSGWSGLLAVVGLLVFGFVVWRFVSRSGERADSKGRNAWRLGPWPVQPGAIRTREELILAFEYLSLLNLGPPARHWNHRFIAGRLGNLPAILSEEYQRRLAAEELAAFYEQARYAPLSEPLPEGVLAAARNDLSFLARMPAV